MSILMIAGAVFLVLFLGAAFAFLQRVFFQETVIETEHPDAQRRVLGEDAAVAACAGPAASAQIFRYVGLADCRVVHSLYSGDRDCKDACIGYGTCRNLCPLGAIVMTSEGPRVSEECDGCGACVKECPSGAIQLVPRNADFFIRCVSKAHPANRTSFCSSACVACDLCRMEGGGAGFAVRDGIARINYKASGNRELAANACPSGCIAPLSAARVDKNAFHGVDNGIECLERENGASDAIK